MRKSELLLAAAAVAIATLTTSASATSAPIRLSSEALSQPPAISNPRLSPDGTRLLTRLYVQGQEMLGIVSLDGSSIKLVSLADEQDLRSYRWAGNGRVVFSLGGRLNWFGQGEKYVSRAFVYDLATEKSIAIGPKVQGMTGDDILWTDPAGKTVLMASQIDRYTYPSVFRVSLDDGKAKLEQGPYDFGWDWYADSAGQVRFGYGVNNNNWFTYYRKPGASGPVAKAPHKYEDDETAGFNYIVRPGSDEGYAIFPSENRRYALYRYNFATEQRGAKLYENATNDLTDAVIDAKTGEPIGVYYTSDRDRVEWIDPAMKKLQASIDSRFAGKTASILSQDRERKRFIVFVGATNDPGTYYLYEPAGDKISRLGKVAAKVDPAGLSTTTYIHYAARDGLKIPAYLTLPVGRAATGLPLIIMPHGGPYGVRDTLGYESEVQFLANRGYAVLQPNYRGSDGYGAQFAKKGHGQWGRAMQDDIDDGMDFLAKQGTVDPKRVCIVGGSYGGYVALWGATRNPERYRCAVSFAGISDLGRQLDYQSDFLTGTRWRSDWQDKVKGERKFDLATVSPLTSAARLKVPVMLVHGDKDTIVLPKQTILYDKALTAAGVAHETYIYPGERHGFTNPKNMQDYLDKLESFLAKHNPS